ncbi:MAG: hypothetical protein KKF41_08590 [Actinobacteria bacterium]|nr:hypothetical protein [Actinomycetota bacterium]MBU1942899.1 hypothetical protein [Actinomycetota bacterium]MBU2687631.1 hypothetical protein [Actinomycetota bacterium]
MTPTIQQLTRRRLVNKIPRRALVEAGIGCEETWILRLESGYQGNRLAYWRDQYETALNAVLEDRKGRR